MRAKERSSIYYFGPWDKSSLQYIWFSMFEFVKHTSKFQISSSDSSVCQMSNKDIITELVLFRAQIPCYILVEFAARDAINPTLHGSKRTGWVDPPSDVSTKKVVLLDCARCACLSWYVQNSSRHYYCMSTTKKELSKSAVVMVVSSSFIALFGLIWIFV